MTRCPLLCGRNIKLKEKKKERKRKRLAILKKKKIVRWIIDNKKDWRREEKVKANYRKIEKIVLQKFLK